MTFTFGPAWNCPGLTVIAELGLRSMPNVAEATSRASGMMSPVVWTLARPSRLAPKSSPKPPATEIVWAGLAALKDVASLMMYAVESPSISVTEETFPFSSPMPDVESPRRFLSSVAGTPESIFCVSSSEFALFG